MHSKLLRMTAAGALVALAVPGAAVAGDRDDARVAIAAAKAKIEANEKAGVGGEAADVQARARAALELAQREFRKSDEDHAYSAAQEASALADLAAVTAEMSKLSAERNQLAQR